MLYPKIKVYLKFLEAIYFFLYWFNFYIFFLYYLVLPSKFISSKPLRALNKFKTDGLKKTWKRGNDESFSNTGNFLQNGENFINKPRWIRDQTNSKFNFDLYRSRIRDTNLNNIEKVNNFSK